MAEYYSNLRHGEKDKTGRLTPEGKEMARKKAREIYERIKALPEGTVVHITPSSIDRAEDTRRIIEEELKSLVEPIDSIYFFSVHDREGIADTAKVMERKIVITDIQPQSIIGFSSETEYIPAWKKYGEVFKGDDQKLMRAWAATIEELSSSSSEFANEKAQTVNIDPSEFIQTPEEEAIKYLRLSKRLGEITKKHFPGHPFWSIQVGHGVADFATLALMGKEITASNLTKLNGEESRKFLESAGMSILENGEIAVNYRDEKINISKTFEQIIVDLKKASQIRRETWKNLN